jgi:hypothetical protein
MERRQLLKLAPPVLLSGLAGCTSDSSQPSDSEGSKSTESGSDLWRDVFEIEEVRVDSEYVELGGDGGWVGYARVMLTNISKQTVEDARLHFSFREYEDAPPATTVTADMSFINPGTTMEVDLRTEIIPERLQYGSVQKIDYSFP